MRRIAVIVVFILIMLLIVPVQANQNGVPQFATTGGYRVTTTADESDGTCNSSHCSLREAIIAANNDTGMNPIVYIPNGIYTLTLVGADEDAAATGDLDITRFMTIIGEGRDTTIIDGNGTDRVFDVHGASFESHNSLTPAMPHFVLSNVTIQNGFVSGASGGGLRISSSESITPDITLIDVLIQNSQADDGGGLALKNVNVKSYRLRLDNNTATNRGGGLFLDGGDAVNTISALYNSFINMNTALYGGGVYLLTDTSLTPHDSDMIGLMYAAVVNNTAQDGAGIYAATPSDDIYITGTTISGNQATNNGGGMVMDSARLMLRFVTLTNNTADSDANGSGMRGDLSATGANLLLTLEHSIMWGNFTAAVCDDCSGTDPLLLPLADNGGDTLTHALAAESPLIDSLSGNMCHVTNLDQRGVPYGRFETTCEPGAYAYVDGLTTSQIPPVPTISAYGESYLPGASVNFPTLYEITVEFNEAMYDAPNSTTNSNEIDNPLNYRVIAVGNDGTFQTETCHNVRGDDVAVPYSVVFNRMLFENENNQSDDDAVISIMGKDEAPLPPGYYRIFICDEIQDTDGNALDGNRDLLSGGDAWFNVQMMPTPVATLTVTTTLDTADGVCDSDCSLRDAVRTANANTGQFTIIYVPAGEYDLTLSGVGEDNALTGDLDIREDMAIIGEGRNTTYIYGDAIDRIIDIHNVTGFVLDSVTIANGDADDYGGGVNGLGYDNRILRSRIEDNMAYWGSAIYAPASGSRIYATEVTDNNGTAVYAEGDISIYNSVFSYNLGSSFGSAIEGASINLYNSTLSNNISSAGVIYFTNSLIMFQNTIADNSSGLFIGTDANVIAVGNIIANNEGANCTNYPDAAPSSQPLPTGYFNIVDDATCDFGERNLYNTDPLLLPWEDTDSIIYPLAENSPANDIFMLGKCYNAVDQMGVYRQADGLCDVGASESFDSSNPLNVPANLQIVDYSGGFIHELNLSWDDTNTTETASHIERSYYTSFDGGTSWYHAGSTPANVSNFTDDTVLCGTYYYRVRAYQASGDVYSPYSNTVSMTNTCNSIAVDIYEDVVDGVCWEDGYECSLREALDLVHTLPGDIIVYLLPGTYTVESPLEVQRPLTIAGFTTGEVIVDLGGLTHFLEARLDDGSYLNVQNMTIINGNSFPFGGDGVVLDQVIPADDVTMRFRHLNVYDSTGNTIVSDLRGDGFYYIEHSLFRNNSSRLGIVGFSGSVSEPYIKQLYIADSVFTENYNTITSSGSVLRYSANQGYVSIERSAFINNGLQGIAQPVIDWSGSSGLFYIHNSTFSGNAGSPSILDFSGSSNVLEVINVTMLNDNPAAGIAWDFNVSGASSLQMFLYNSILDSQNGMDFFNCNATPISGDSDYNILNNMGCNPFNGATDFDARLLPLADNGGDTYTFALKAGSPAVDGGSCLFATDQRGFARPVGETCDIGAYEGSIAFIDTPQNLTVTNVTVNSVELTWDDTADETAYVVEQWLDGEAFWLEIDQTSANDTDYTQTGISCSTTLYYRVRAYNSVEDEYSEPSNIVSATTTDCPPPPTIDGISRSLADPIYAGESVTFTPTVTSAGTPSYAWYKVNYDTDPSPVLVSNNAVFTSPALMATTRYRLVVINEFGSAQTHVLVTVIGRPVAACEFTAIAAPAPENYGLYFTPISGDGNRVLLFYTYYPSVPDMPSHSYPIQVYDVPTQTVVDTIWTEFDFTSTLHFSDINYDGSVVAFVSAGNHSGGNADGGYEVFIWEEGLGITQITHSSYSSDYESLSISSDGNTIVFASPNDADGSGESLGEIYYYKWERGSGISLLADVPSGASYLSDTFVIVSNNGTAAAFASSENPLGQNADGNRELFLLRDGHPLTQITNTTGTYSVSLGPSEVHLSGDGSRVAVAISFEGNWDSGWAVYLWDSAMGLQQITPLANSRLSVPTGMNDAGTRIAIASYQDLVPGYNADLSSEDFYWEEGSGFNQVTSEIERFVYWGFMSDSGNRMAFFYVFPNEIFPYTVDCTLSAPADLTITDVGRDVVSLEWSDYADTETEYRIERSADDGDTWTEVGTLGANLTAYVDDSATCETGYQYRVRAHEAPDYFSGYSNVASTTTTSCLFQTPLNLSYSNRTDTTITLSWNDVEGESNYRLERSTDNGDTWLEIALIPANTAIHSDTGLTCDTSYQYRLRAYDAVDDVYSTYSNTLTVSTTPCLQTGPIFTVTTTEDTNDGYCGIVHCTLREAVIAANNMAGANTITVPAGTYMLALSGAEEDNALSGDLDVLEAVIIQGAGAASTIIDGNTTDRIFDVFDANAFNLSNMTLQNGAVDTLAVTTDNGVGGAVLLRSGYTGTAALTDLIIQDNVAASGGGVTVYGDVQITRVRFLNNTASDKGGGLAADGDDGLFEVVESEFRDNQASMGGGIYAVANTAHLAVEQTLFTGNLADLGGAITVVGNSMTSEFHQTTFSNNDARASGGAVAILANVSQFSFTTFTNNIADSDMNSDGEGNALYFSPLNPATSSVSVFGTIIYGNGSTPECVADGTIITQGYNIFGQMSGCTINEAVAGDSLNDITGQNPLLLPLADNGGFTQTHGLELGSAAIDAIPAESCTEALDQRGISRPQSTGCDIGAYEATEAYLALPAPTNLSATAVSYEAIDLSWQDNATNESNYVVERSLDGNTWTVLDPLAANTTEYTDSGLDCDTTYQYQVRAYRSADDRYSDYTNIASATTAPCMPVPVVGEITTSSIEWSWNDVLTETEYRLERSDDGGTTWSEIAQPAQNVTTYTDNTVVCETSYVYQLRAYRSIDGLYSEYSDPIPVNTLFCPLVAPTGLSVTATTATTIDLQWSESNSSETAILLERSDDGLTWVQIAELAPDTTTYQDTLLTCETIYDYQVRVYRADDDSYSEYSNMVSPMTGICAIPNPPTNLQVTTTNARSVDLLWTDNDTSVTQYTVERSRNNGASWQAYPALGDDVMTFTASNLTCQTDWQFRVRGVRLIDSQPTGYSNTVTIETLPCPALVTPNAPVVIDFNTVSVSLSLTADATGEATNWQLERLTAGVWQSIATLPVTTTQHTDNNLSCSTGYSYRVRAYRAEDSAVSAYSAETPVTTETCAVPFESTVGLYRNGLWIFTDTNATGTPDIQFRFGPQEAGWYPIVGDWDGDGVDGIGVYRNGLFLLRNTTDSGIHDTMFYFGYREAGWQPIVGDWNGDGVDTIGVYKAGSFMLTNDHATLALNHRFSLNTVGLNWVAIAGDWDGNGADSVGLYTAGSFMLTNNVDASVAPRRFSFGPTTAGWYPVAGDWNTDGTDTIGIYSQSIWRLRNGNTAGIVDIGFNFGQRENGWIPLASYRGGVAPLLALSQAANIRLDIPVEPTVELTISPTVPPVVEITPEVTVEVTEMPATSEVVITPEVTAEITDVPILTPIPVEPTAVPLPTDTPLPESTAAQPEATQEASAP